MFYSDPGRLALSLRRHRRRVFTVQRVQRQVLANAKALCAELQEQGLRIVSGGTDNHLMLVDVWMDGKGVTGLVPHCEARSTSRTRSHAKIR